VVEVKGEAYATRTLDPCGWQAEPKAVVAPKEHLFHELGRYCTRALDAIGVAIIIKPGASA